MNVCVVDGRVTRDPEMKYIGAKNTALLEFSIANETGYGDYKKTHFFNCKLWGARAEGLANHIYKGKPLTLQGEMQMQSWDGNDGKKRYKWELNVMQLNFHMNEPKNGGGEGFPQPDSGKPTATPPKEDPFKDFNDSIPF